MNGRRRNGVRKGEMLPVKPWFVRGMADNASGSVMALADTAAAPPLANGKAPAQARLTSNEQAEV